MSNITSVNSGISYQREIAKPQENQEEKAPHQVCREHFRGQENVPYEAIENCIQAEELRRFMERRSQGK